MGLLVLGFEVCLAWVAKHASLWRGVLMVLLGWVFSWVFGWVFGWVF